MPLYLAGRGSAQGHDPYPFILFQAQRIWYQQDFDWTAPDFEAMRSP
ncbi:MAG: hypothetical protein VKK80_02680 [Prochlorothrix sp.]|nr:hypothetical protein [Prochlorothrix sp.]